MEYVGILLSTALLLGLIFLTLSYLKMNKRKPTKRFSFDLSIVPIKWTEIERMVQQGGPANFRQSIVEADKLVDMVLRSKVPGETMGERLKKSAVFFDKPTYNDLWTAHKIRNKVVHEADFEGLGSDAQLAVRNFKKALKALKVLN